MDGQQRNAAHGKIHVRRFNIRIFLHMENSSENYPKSSFFLMGSEAGVFYNIKNR